MGQKHDAWLLGSFVVLPYASYLGLVGLAVMLLGWLVTYPREIWHRLRRQGWVWLILGMGMSVALAEDPGQAALQSTNFWPFFFFFAGLSVYITRLPNPLHRLQQWAFWLLMASIPINLRAFIEYLPALAARFGLSPWPAGVGQTSQRVDSVFGNPNVLAAYLVIIFGLGLGLCLQALPAASSESASASRSHPPTPNSLTLSRLAPRTVWIYGAMALIPLGVFFSGSRSGVMVLLVQLLIAMALMRRHRWAMGAGLGIIAAILAGVIYRGVGGRSLVQALTSSLIRVDIWQLSIPFIRQHPWFGIGFGGFQANYEPGSVAHIPFLHHVHNLWLYLAMEAGLPVMLLFTAIVGWICYRAVRYCQRGRLPVNAQPLLVGYGLGFLACILFSLFDMAFFDARVNILGWTMLAVLQAIPDLVDESRC